MNRSNTSGTEFQTHNWTTSTLKSFAWFLVSWKRNFENLIEEKRDDQEKEVRGMREDIL